MDEADLTWVYFVGIGAALLIIFCIAVIFWRVKNQNKISQNVKKERKRGIMKQWG